MLIVKVCKRWRISAFDAVLVLHMLAEADLYVAGSCRAGWLFT